MQIFQTMNVNVQPLNQNDIDMILEFLVERFKEQGNQLKYRFIDQKTFRIITLQWFKICFEAARRINSMKNQEIIFSTKYTINGKILGVILICDLDLLLLKVKQGNSHPFFNFLLNVQNKPNQKTIFMARGAVSKEFFKKRIGEIALIQRSQYFNSKGYDFISGLMAHKSTISLFQKFGGEKQFNVVVKNKQGLLLQKPFYFLSTKKVIQSYNATKPKL